jgi:hypothetical protein
MRMRIYNILTLILMPFVIWRGIHEWRNFKFKDSKKFTP